MAASGLAAVVYGAEAPEQDVHAVLRHLRADTDPLGLDVDKFGLFAASGNVTVALSALMRDRLLRCRHCFTATPWIWTARPLSPTWAGRPDS